MTDGQILDLIRTEPYCGCRELLDRYGGYMYVIIKNTLNSSIPEADAEECVSDTLSDVIEKNKCGMLDADRLKGFISTVARRKALDMNRRYSRKSGSDVFSDENEFTFTAEDDVQGNVEDRSVSDYIWKEVMKLGEPDSEILILQYFYSRPVKEIAAKLSMTTAAVNKRSIRARKKLREIFEAGKEFLYG